MDIVFLHAHADKQNVAFTRWRQPAALDSSRPQATLLADGVLTDVAQVRLLGHRDNAHLVLWLLSQQAAGTLPTAMPIRAVSPALVRSSAPQAAVEQLWQGCESATIGFDGHAVTQADRETWRLMADGTPARLFGHPAWPVFRFCGHAGYPWALQLLQDIVDVRFFDHPDRPGRISRLAAFCGVSPENAATFLSGSNTRGHNMRRFEQLTRIWWPADMLSLAQRPEGFLARIFMSRDAVSGLLRANETLLRLIRELWLSRRGGQPFVPSLFFASDVETAAWQSCTGTSMGSG